MFSLHPQPGLPLPLSMLLYYSNHSLRLPSFHLFPLSPFPSSPLLLSLSMLLYYNNNSLRLFPPSPSFLSPLSPLSLSIAAPPSSVEYVAVLQQPLHPPFSTPTRPPPLFPPLPNKPSSFILPPFYQINLPFFLFTFYNLIKKEKKKKKKSWWKCGKIVFIYVKNAR